MTSDYTPCSDSLSLRHRGRRPFASPDAITRGVILQKARRHTVGAPQKRGRRHGAPTACRRTVSGTFHSPLGVLFTFPSRYWCAIGRPLVFRLGGWSPRFRSGFFVPRRTREHRREARRFRVRGCHPLWPAVPGRSAIVALCHSLPGMRPRRSGPTTPRAQRAHACTRGVWALPGSLATTTGISVDSSSSGY